MTPVAGALRSEFKMRSEAAALLRERHLHALREERVRRERRDDQRDVADQDFLDLAVTMLTVSEIATFRAELDMYETASVIALQENERALEAAQRQVEEILLRAHVLPDGRRVFKTEDGTRVFDEFGVEIEASVITPESIADERPRYETYEAARDARDHLRQERKAILD